MQYLEFPPVDGTHGKFPDRMLSFLGRTSILLYCMIEQIEEVASYKNKDIDTTKKAMREVFTKIFSPSRNVYYDLLNYALNSLEYDSDLLHGVFAELSHGNSAHYAWLKLAHNLVSSVLDHIEALSSLCAAPNLSDSVLSPALDSLNCTLGSLIRMLDPIEGPSISRKAAYMHKISSKLPPTRISEPIVNYYCPPPNRLL